MRTRKTKKADLEGKRFIFKEVGFIIALLFVLSVLELKSYEKNEIDFSQFGVESSLEEVAEFTPRNLPPPPPKKVQPTSIINIVENDVEVEQDIVIDVEADQLTEVEEYIPYIPEVSEEVEVVEKPIFVVVESMPSFVGGEVARVNYLRENIKYPQTARECNIQGTVSLTFIVETDGSIKDVRILRGIGGGCDEEALRVVKNMPPWNPGRQRDKSVRVQFNMPIIFRLR